jgi:hypothetical protein
MAALAEELVAVETENPPGHGLGSCERILRDAVARLGFSPGLIDLASAASWEDPCIAELDRLDESSTSQRRFTLTRMSCEAYSAEIAAASALGTARVAGVTS